MKNLMPCSLKFNIFATVVTTIMLGVNINAYAQYRNLDEVESTINIKTNEDNKDLLETYHGERGKLTQIGTPKGGFPVVKGTGKKVKLVDALKIVVPNGWTARKSGSVDVNQQVTLTTAGNWVEAVANFAKQTQTSIMLNWDEKIVTVRGVNKAVISNDYIKLANKQSEAKVAVNEKAKTIIVLPKWTLVAGKSLRENIENWATTSDQKYTVKWQAVNYMIDADATFEGAFDDENKGPIAQVISLFSKNDVPLKATFMENNRVLLIENATYQQDYNRLSSYALKEKNN